MDFQLLIRISKLLLENYLSSLWWCVFGFLFVWVCLLFVWVGLFVWVFFLLFLFGFGGGVWFFCIRLTDIKTDVFSDCKVCSSKF